MAFPSILFNSSTGSDTAASGAGPGTALSGTGAAIASNTTVTLTVDAPDLSGVATDGSACMWVDSSTGRQFSRITAVNNIAKTVTVATAYGVTESGRNWGIGGKRATLDNANSRKLFTADLQNNWEVVLEDNQTISSVIAGTVGDRHIRVRSSVVGTTRTITQTANAACFTVSDQVGEFTDLKFCCSNGTKTAAYGIGLGGNNGNIRCTRCIFGDATNTLLTGFHRGTYINFLIDCEIVSCTSHGVHMVGGNGSLQLIGCWIHACGGDGIKLEDYDTSGSIINNIISGNTGKGINYSSDNFQRTPVIIGNVIHGNTSDGILFTFSSSFGYTTSSVILNNQITGNGGYGINTSGISVTTVVQSDYNNFGTGGTANTSGDVNGFTKGSNSLNVDPGYVNAGSNNFAVGTNTKAEGFPDAARTIGNNLSATTSYIDIGAAQRAESSGVFINRKVVR